MSVETAAAIETKPSDCPNFESCEANLCPLDNDGHLRTWFADEPICERRDVPEWVKRQRRVAIAAGKDPDAGYFTREMLDTRCAIRRGITGLNPDHLIVHRPREVKEWLKAHPGMSDETRVALAERGRALARKFPIRSTAGPNDPHDEQIDPGAVQDDLTAGEAT